MSEHRASSGVIRPFLLVSIKQRGYSEEKPRNTAVTINTQPKKKKKENERNLMISRVLSRKKSSLAVQILKPHGPNSLINQQQGKRGKSKYLSNRVKRLQSEMEEISKEQTTIKQGQREIREKFEAIELECEQLRRETNQIMQQSMKTQIRLAFMFQILKARQNHEFDKATKLTDAFRALVARENQPK